ncbi:MAG TPA: histidine kinase [Acidimicrobiales bacterium]|nr:histidine kinase [Acidimicrobiales bacterium]
MTWRLLVVGRWLAVAGLTVWGIVVVLNGARPVVGVPIATVVTGAALMHRRMPVVVLGVTLGGIVAMASLAGFDGPDDPFIVALLWASYAVGRNASIRQQPWAAAATLAFVSLNLTGGDVSFPADLVFPAIFTAVPWLAGLWMQVLESRSRRAEAVAREAVDVRDHEVRRATTEERLRLAREIHDVAAHHMTAVSLHAQALRERVERGGAVEVGQLRAIEGAARHSLEELRRVLGVLRPSHGDAELFPLPSLDDLPKLVESCRLAGQRVELVNQGEQRPVPSGMSLALYRIIQESLSNAGRHAPGAVVEVRIRWSPDRVMVRTTNDAAGRRLQFVAGNGVLGMRERATLYGGTVQIGPGDAGSWVVELTMPVPA